MSFAVYCGATCGLPAERRCTATEIQPLAGPSVPRRTREGVTAVDGGRECIGGWGMSEERMGRGRIEIAPCIEAVFTAQGHHNLRGR